MESYLLGIDVGTTGIKALLLEVHGGLKGSAAVGCPISTPHPLWSEQNPADWWTASLLCIRRLIADSDVEPSQVAGVGLTGQMHGLVLLDSLGEVLRPCIMWNDQCTFVQCERIRERLDKERLVQITGNDALSGFTAPKILWVRQHEPDVFAMVRHILLPKDYVRFKLTGDYATDCSDGAGTILFDLKERTWSKEVLEELEIPADWLPMVFESPELTGHVSAAAATETGLIEGTPVVGGAGDQAAQAVGVGAIHPGIIALTLGTSGVVFAPTAMPQADPKGRLQAFCHAVPGRWHLMGVMLSAAGALRWYHDALTPQIDYDALVAEAESIPPGSEGLLFLPYLTGERTPYPDPLARAAWVGLTLRHLRGHMTRAVLEGVAFGLRDCFELVREAGLCTIEQVRVSGGGAKSPVWLQILADVLGVELVTVKTTEGAAYGAAMLAGVGVGA
jgi:xylulokinase